MTDKQLKMILQAQYCNAEIGRRIGEGLYNQNMSGSSLRWINQNVDKIQKLIDEVDKENTGHD